MMSPVRGLNIYHLLSQVLLLGVPGEVVELGCHAGDAAVLMQKILMEFQSAKQLHLYDSFQGLPNPSEKDHTEFSNPFQKGSLCAKEATLINRFKDEKLAPPRIYAGWFEELLPAHLPDQICFAHLDGDLYQSIKVSLEAIFPRLTPNAIVVIDDYGWEFLPGVKQACDEFFKDKSETVCHFQMEAFPKCHQGFFRKSSSLLQLK